jgi:hypothetical protein
MKVRHLISGAVAALVIGAAAAPAPARAVVDTFYVNGSKSSVGAGGSCASPDFIDIVAAVEDADVSSGDIIHVCKGLYRLSDPLDLDGENKNLIFEGDGKTKTTLDGRNQDRIVNGAGQNVTFRDIKLIQGRTDGSGGAIKAATVTLDRVAISLNRADGDGGAAEAVTTVIVRRIRFDVILVIFGRLYGGVREHTGREELFAVEAEASERIILNNPWTLALGRYHRPREGGSGGDDRGGR